MTYHGIPVYQFINAKFESKVTIQRIVLLVAFYSIHIVFLKEEEIQRIPSIRINDNIHSGTTLNPMTLIQTN